MNIMKLSFITLISFSILTPFSLFALAANQNTVECADGACTIPNEMFEAIKGTDGLSKLDRAMMLYKNFAYADGLVLLSKTDAVAKAELDTIISTLKSEADNGNAFSQMTLSRIYFLQDDFDNFRKFADPTHTKAMQNVSKLFGAALSDQMLVSMLSGDNDNYQTRNLLNNFFSFCIDSGSLDTAKKVFDSDPQFAKSCNSWYVIRMYSSLLEKSSDKELKEKFIKYLEGIDNSYENKYALIYALTYDDPVFEKQKESSLKKLEEMPEVRKWRTIYEAANNLSKNKLAKDALRKLYDLNGISRDWEKHSLAMYMIYGDEDDDYYYDGGRPIDKNNPDLPKALEILGSIKEDFNASAILSVYRELGDMEKYNALLKTHLENVKNESHIRYTLRSIAIGDYPYFKDEDMAMQLCKQLTKEERADVFLDLARTFTYTNNYALPNINEAKKFYKMALDEGNMQALESLPEHLPYSEAIALFDKYPEERFAHFQKGLYLAENGKWDEALKSFEKAESLGCGRAYGIFGGAYLVGRGVAKDEKKAAEYFSKFIKSIADPCASHKMDVSKACNYISSVFGRDSEVNLYFLNLLKADPKHYDKAISSLYHLTNTYQIENRDSIKSEYLASILKKEGSSLHSLKNLYTSDWTFYDAQKAFKYAKLLFESRSFWSLDYIEMLFDGFGDVKDPKLAFEMLDKFNHSKKTIKQIKAYCYENGLGVEKDLKKAEELRSSLFSLRNNEIRFGPKSAIAKEKLFALNFQIDSANRKKEKAPALLFNLGNFYLEKNTPYYDAAKGIEILEKVAADYPEKLKSLAYKYRALKDYKKYFETMLQFVEKITDTKLIEGAYLDLGLCYLNGTGVAKNPEKAFEYFQKEAALPLSSASFRALEAMAYCKDNGFGTPLDTEGANKIREDLKKYFFDGVLEKYNLSYIANMYNAKDRLGVNPKMFSYWIDFILANKAERIDVAFIYDYYANNPKSRNWDKASRIADIYSKNWGEYPEAMWRQAVLDMSGLGRTKNTERAISLLEKASSLYNATAMETLAYFYDKGMGVKQDTQKAAELMGKVASQINTNYRGMAKKYVTGTLGFEDLERAKYLLKLGADSGDLEAQKDLDRFDSYVKDLQNSD